MVSELVLKLSFVLSLCFLISVVEEEPDSEGRRNWRPPLWRRRFYINQVLEDEGWRR